MPEELLPQDIEYEVISIYTIKLIFNRIKKTSSHRNTIPKAYILLTKKLEKLFKLSKSMVKREPNKIFNTIKESIKQTNTKLIKWKIFKTLGPLIKISHTGFIEMDKKKAIFHIQSQ